MMSRTLQSVPRGIGTADPLEHHERLRFRAAALHASRVYPGSIGELIQRELTAYADFGYRFADNTLISRLAAEILATSVSDRVDENGCSNSADLGRIPAAGKTDD
jgi:hypothetical protein